MRVWISLTKEDLVLTGKLLTDSTFVASAGHSRHRSVHFALAALLWTSTRFALVTLGPACGEVGRVEALLLEHAVQQLRLLRNVVILSRLRKIDLTLHRSLQVALMC